VAVTQDGGGDGDVSECDCVTVWGVGVESSDVM
jgi:hypothetical protein